jgi:hypothetical protein
MKEFRLPGLLLPLLLSLGLPPVSEATSFQAIPFEETVKEAPVVVRGRVSMQYVEWATLSNGSKRLYTYIELQPLTLLKAPAAWAGRSRMIVREIGGQKDGVGMSVPGSAKFSIGEEVVVFASDSVEPDGSYDLRGLMLSKLIVKESQDGQEVLAGPAISMGEGARPGQIIHADHDGDAERGHTVTSQWTVQSLRELIERQGGSGIREEAQIRPEGGAAPTGPGKSESVPPSPTSEPGKSGNSESVPTPEAAATEGGASGVGTDSKIWLWAGGLALVLLYGLYRKAGS